MTLNVHRFPWFSFRVFFYFVECTIFFSVSTHCMVRVWNNNYFFWENVFIIPSIRFFRVEKSLVFFFLVFYFPKKYSLNINDSQPFWFGGRTFNNCMNLCFATIGVVRAQPHHKHATRSTTRHFCHGICLMTIPSNMQHWPHLYDLKEKKTEKKNTFLSSQLSLSVGKTGLWLNVSASIMEGITKKGELNHHITNQHHNQSPSFVATLSLFNGGYPWIHNCGWKKFFIFFFFWNITFCHAIGFAFHVISKILTPFHWGFTIPWNFYTILLFDGIIGPIEIKPRKNERHFGFGKLLGIFLKH